LREAEQGAGRHHELAAMLAREIDEMLVDEDGTDAEHQRGLAGAQEGLGDGGQQARRRAFDHEIGQRLKLADRDDWRRVREMGEARDGLAAVVGGNRRQHAAGDTKIQRLCDLQPDGAEARDGDAERPSSAALRSARVNARSELVHGSSRSNRPSIAEAGGQGKGGRSQVDPAACSDTIGPNAL
jgi:hypothetical protein